MSDDRLKGLVWPKADFTAVPYHVFSDPGLFDLENEKIFRGPTWHFLGLECEVPRPGDFITGYVGQTPYVLSRGRDGELHAFVNRCAHRGAAVVRELRGNAPEHKCVYHQWCYSPAGDLIGVPFERGLKGNGGYPGDFDKASHGLEKLRVERFSGIVFGSFSDAAPPLADYLGAPICERLGRYFDRQVRVTGYHRQTIGGNWKLFAENTRDLYHGPLLHSFLAKFGISAPNQTANSHLGGDGVHSMVTTWADADAGSAGLTGGESKDLQLEDPGVAQGPLEFDDGMNMTIVSLFPSSLFTMVANVYSIRQIRPKAPDQVETVFTYFVYEDDDEDMLAVRRKQANMYGPGGYVAMEDAEALELVQQRLMEGSSLVEMGGREIGGDVDTMLTESPVRGFWRGYCDYMGIPVANG